jgi:sugar lactone lactonase YvrE
VRKEDRVADVLTARKYFATSFLSLFCILVLYAVMPPAVQSAPGDIVTIAGGGTGGLGDDGLATSATLSYPTSISVDVSGNIYIADTYNNRIRKVDHSSGFITTVAGNGTPAFSGDNGPATSASLNYPTGVWVDALGNIYIADTVNRRIRKVDTSGIITTVAGNGTPAYTGDGGPATSASLYDPFGVSVDALGNIYIADRFYNSIRKVDGSSHIITTVAGNGTPAYSGDNGPATSASLYSPSGVSVDALGNVYIADLHNNRIRRVDASGIITTVAGNGTPAFSGDGGPATSASLDFPSGVSVDASENIYIADYYNHRIREVSPAPGIRVTDSIPPDNDLQMPFGTVTEGNTSDQTVTVTNSGTLDLVINAISSPTSSFSITTNNCSNQTIAPAESCTLTVHFAPTAAGAFNDSFDIPSNDPKAPTVTLITSGTGTALSVPKIQVTDTIPPNTDLLMPFGAKTIGVASDQTITITNSGNADLSIGTIASANPLAAPFSITDNCSGKTIAFAESCTLTVHFAPTAVGTFNDSFDIPSDDPDAPTITVSLSGTGTPVPVPNITVIDSVAPNDDHQIPFGDITQGVNSPAETVTISNTGNAVLTVTNIQIAGTDPGQFSLNLNGGTTPCGSATPSIAAQSYCTVAVLFSPASTGAKSATLAIASNDGTVNVALSGTGLSSVTNNPPSAPMLVFPANGQIGLGTTVSYRWKKSTDPDGDAVSYHLYTCTNQDFTGTGCTQPVDVASSGANQIYLAGFGMYGGLMMIGMVFAGSRKGRKGLLLLIVIVLLATGITLASCGGGSSTTPSPSPTNEVTHKMANLSPGTTYYWKVVAGDSKGGTTESQVWSFSTQ